MNIYEEGDYIEITFTVTDDAGGAVPSSSVHFAIQAPGSSSEWVYSVSGATITVVDALTYRFGVWSTGYPGTWIGRAWSTAVGAPKPWAARVTPTNLPMAPPTPSTTPPSPVYLAGDATMLQGRAISPTAPTTGQALLWDGSAWEPGSVASGAEFNILEYGGHGDWTLGVATGTDDTPALQAALDAMAAAGYAGGVIRFPPLKSDGTPAAYRLRGSATYTATGTRGNIVIDARGARIWFDAVATHQVFLSITNAFRVVILGGEWYGWRGDVPVTQPAFQSKGLFSVPGGKLILEDVVIQGWRSSFSTDADSGLIFGSDVTLHRCQIGSCITGPVCPIIRCGSKATGAFGLDIDACYIFDYAVVSGSLVALGSGGGGALVVGPPVVAAETTFDAPTVVRIRDTHIDEGSGTLIFGDVHATTLSASFSMPRSFYDVPNTGYASTTIQVADTSWMRVGERLYIPVAGYVKVEQVVDATHVRIGNYGGPYRGTPNAAFGTTISGGVTVLGQYHNAVEIDGLMLNMQPTTNTAALDFRQIHRVTVSNSFVRNANVNSWWAKGRYLDAFEATNTTTISSDASGAYAVDFDSTVGTVVLDQSHTDLTMAPGSTARQTIVQSGALRNMASYTTAGRPSAASVRPGTYIWDTTLKHVLVSDGSTWVDLSVAAGADATSLRSKALDAAIGTAGAGQDGQVIYWDNAGAAYKLKAVGGGGVSSTSVIDWCTRMVALGYAVPDGFAGQYTVGSLFYLTSAGNITGARFYWQHGSTENVRISLWRHNGSGGGYTRLEFVDVAVTSAGIYTATWSTGGGSGGSHVADTYRRYMVTMRGTYSGYFTAANMTPVPTAYTPQPVALGQPLLAKPGLAIENWYCSTVGQTDTAPPEPTNVTTYSALVEPVVTIN